MLHVITCQMLILTSKLQHQSTEKSKLLHLLYKLKSQKNCGPLFALKVVQLTYMGVIIFFQLASYALWNAKLLSLVKSVCFV